MRYLFWKDPFVRFVRLGYMRSMHITLSSSFRKHSQGPVQARRKWNLPEQISHYSPWITLVMWSWWSRLVSSMLWCLPDFMADFPRTRSRLHTPPVKRPHAPSRARGENRLHNRKCSHLGSLVPARASPSPSHVPSPCPNTIPFSYCFAVDSNSKLTSFSGGEEMASSGILIALSGCSFPASPQTPGVIPQSSKNKPRGEEVNQHFIVLLNSLMRNYHQRYFLSLLSTFLNSFSSQEWKHLGHRERTGRSQWLGLKYWQKMTLIW